MSGNDAVVVSVSGPLVVARLPSAVMSSQVEVGRDRVVGEVIRLAGDLATVQMYESTTLLRPGDPVWSSGDLLSAELGPGLLGRVVDGIQRPLEALREQTGDWIRRGVAPPALDRARTWAFTPRLETGTLTSGGEILGTVQETPLLEHRILVPPGAQGQLTFVAPPGSYTVDAVVARVHPSRSAEPPTSGAAEQPLRLFHRWPVRQPRPVKERLAPQVPLITGQRVLDMLFPLAKGGAAAVPGPFGSGKTIVEHQLARWCDANVIVFIGCGERGNEMVDLLEQFTRLTDPRTGRPLLERSVLVANTSNMPVTAREASVYTGVTIAEYFRDQGYDVALMADSTSRWAEALREVAARMEEMPAEEGYPAYLGSRLAAFYERAGQARVLSGATGSVTIIGSVSPPGGDFSEPVTRHTRSLVRTFWALSKTLADARHYPAIDWNESFSEYAEAVGAWWDRIEGGRWTIARRDMLRLLAEADRPGESQPAWIALQRGVLVLLRQADELRQVASIIGPGALSDRQRWTLFAANLVREGFLQQNALDPVDSYCAPGKQLLLLLVFIDLYREAARLIDEGVPFQTVAQLPSLPALQRARTEIPDDQLDRLTELAEQVRRELAEAVTAVRGAPVPSRLEAGSR